MSRSRVHRLLSRVLVRTPCTAGEGAIAGAALAALAALVFGAHVFRAGFLFDDWTLASDANGGGFADAVGTFSDGYLAGRPAATVYATALYRTFVTGTELHFVWAIGLGVLTSLLFFVLLREMRLEPLHAWLAAALVLLLPASDATRLWLGSTVSNWTLSLYLAGTLIAVRGLRAEGRRAAVLHAIALAFYLASVLTYEIATAAIALSVLVYRLSGASWRRAAGRWALDLGVVAAGALYVIAHIPRAGRSLSSQLDHARNMQGEARELLLSAGIPNGRFSVPFVAVLVLAAAALVLSRVRSWGAAEGRAEIRRWLVVLVAGAVGAAAGWAVFVPADDFYMPLQPGIGTRTNAVAGLGLVVAIYALIVLAALVPAQAARLRVAPRTSATVAAVLGAGILGLLFVERVRDDARKYQTAVDVEQAAFDTMKARLPSPPRESTIYILGFPFEPSPGVFTLVLENDASGAARFLWDDRTLRAINVSAGPDFRDRGRRGPRLTCETGGVRVHGVFFTDVRPSPYGSTELIHVRQRERVPIRTVRECRTATARYARDL